MLQECQPPTEPCLLPLDEGTWAVLAVEVWFGTGSVEYTFAFFPYRFGVSVAIKLFIFYCCTLILYIYIYMIIYAQYIKYIIICVCAN